MKKQTVINGINILKNEGLLAFFKRAKVHKNYMKQIKKYKNVHNFKDILFINGCPIDYCERYRVHHKMQELMAYGISSDEVTPDVLSEEIIKFYRAFIIYRMPWDEKIEEFIKLIHENNKIVFFDIDDLVFDLKYTNNIEELKKLTKEQREEYDNGVIRYGKLLDLCDYGITTTKVIANEMKKHVKDVCVDKNVASLQMQKYSEIALKSTEKDENKIIIGYASGSLTHNADFRLILPSILKILKKYQNVYLKLIGALSVPSELKEFEERIIISPFVNFTELPNVICGLDINLAPLEDTFFNSAKSSIKWMEAGLVGVPTIASNVGNFKDSITDGVDGILCKDNEWLKKLEELILNKDYRTSIGKNAYKTVYNFYTPITNGKIIADFIKKRWTKNICFIIPAAKISGGTMVATKHATILKKNGYDVTMINTDPYSKETTKLFYGKDYIPVVSNIHNYMDMSIDVMVATMWFTLFFAQKYEKCNTVKYLVQGKECMFYQPDDYDSLRANSTYYNHKNIQYLTVSKWCKKWLKKDYQVNAKYIPNGIDLDYFPYKKRNFKGKIKILIEGDSSSFYKNVDESFKIANRLDKNKFEIHYLSYNGKPKDWYKVDKFYHEVNHNEVYKIYQNCDILLKSSILESFSYPPLEMMATGGICLVIPNEGNKEYLIDNLNCLMYEKNNIEEAVAKILEISNNSKLRNKIIKNGLETVKSRDWENIKQKVLEEYE